ncbi:hypothetical protein FIE12Z_11236 [Fusarium flagelliforme]|uniref:Heterokaryon incompatibility domain-containing protein n=1 Tax=Fusarium flagelliforme TaxID=2675880 RepID=A0A395M9E0_9HYPO|nr:hypothetical protein FIE12Z_11236 [Fusarium flagelliforme]
MERVNWSTNNNPAQNARDWQTSDLCKQCQDVDLDKVLIAPIHPPEQNRYSEVFKLRISEELLCPLCRFYARLVPAEYRLQLVKSPTFPFNDGRDPDYLFFDIMVPYPYRTDFLRNRDNKIVPIEKAESGGSRYLDVDSQAIDYGVLKNWISHSMKVRLIDCHSRTVTVYGHGDRYVALSYVWGPREEGHSSDDPKSTLRDLNGKSIQVSNVIQDAITVTMGLDLQYLWVDQVCINQDDAEEKQQLLRCMDSIYNQAFLTIVAAAGNRASYDLPGVAYYESAFKKVENSTWSGRGWTFQESFFSRRFLMFTDEQVIFECGGMLQTEDRVRDLDAPTMECGINDLSNIIAQCDGKAQPTSLISLIEKFTCRQLTKEEDVLEAMGGLFNFHSHLEPCIETFWGLPIRWCGYRMLKADLDAYRAGNSHFKHEDIAGAILLGLQWSPNNGERPVTRREGFPSWSWSSWKTVVHGRSYPSTDDETPSGFSIPMHVVTTNNGLVAVNEAFARSLASVRSYETMGYTQTLQFDTQVLEVPFVKWKDYEGRSSYPEDLSIGYIRFGIPRESVRFAVVRSTGSELLSPISRQSSTFRALVWPLFLTCSTADTEDIWKDPGTRTIECVVIGHEYGLLVQTRNGVSKRVGLVRFKCEFLIDGRMRSYNDLDEKWKWSYKVEEVDLRDYFPGSVRTVYLG